MTLGLLAALTDERALDYDPQPRGLPAAREAVCAYYADTGSRLSSEQIVLTTSTSEAYSFLFRLLCDPGSEVLVPQPGYPLFDFLAGLDDVRLKAAPLVYDYGWQIDPEGFRQAITPATRAIVLVHPNNPTGHFTKAWEAEELARLCREFGLSLIVDEVFLDYGFGDFGFGEVPGSFAAGLEGVPVFVVSGLSKIAGLPQMKAAWIVATGPERALALERLEVIADTFLSMNAPMQWALAAVARWPRGDPGADPGARGGQPGGAGSAISQASGSPEAGSGRRLVCRAADSGSAAGRTDGAGAVGARSLGASRLLLRDGGVGLVGDQSARTGTRIQYRSNPSC